MNRLLLAPLLLAACTNAYEPFRVSGYAQEAFSNKADILFVIDTSGSMQDENAALGLKFDTFIRELTAGQDAPGTNGLVDAVDNYIEFASRRSSFIDYRIGITTTDVAGDSGELMGPIVRFGDDAAANAFRRTLLCDTVFFDLQSLPSDPGYTCDPADPEPPAEMTREYLDCVCPDGRVMSTGGNTEEGLEATLMAMCRAVDDPPAVCTEAIAPFTEADIGANAGLLRDGATLIPVVITDEGDRSRRGDLSNSDGLPDEYERAYAAFGKRMVWAVIGPEVGVCNSTGAIAQWEVDRYDHLVTTTDGLWYPIADESSGSCEVADFDTALRELGALLNRLNTVFPLEGVPDETTIRVFVEGRAIDPAEATEQGETLVYGDGWSYDPVLNAVRLHGDAVPDYREQVRIYYLPIGGHPRPLPF